GEIDTLPATVAIQDFAFMGGSMGMAVGESLVMAAERALKDTTPLVVFTAAGG
ncbi:MAG TPA: acetyl-CoA carboxylase carboxyl transferase subunit beta, partial [Alphaproteobacteria bacterium]|nr:acetyl-CoA carboxylase carboxyl transferase subunit beta [Alphaproteobacteria bacterium]